MEAYKGSYYNRLIKFYASVSPKNKQLDIRTLATKE